MKKTHKKYLLPAAITVAAFTLLTGGDLLAQGTKGQGSAPVRVMNSHANPVPVEVLNANTPPGPPRGTATTLSVVADRTKGSAAGAEQSIKTPECPDGMEFLVSALNVSTSIATDSVWEVRVRLAQKYALGPAAPVDLVVVGHGRAHASQFLPAGQPTRDAGEVTVKFIQGEGKPTGFYTAHISGYCGVPYVIENESVGSGQTEGPYPTGWDLTENKQP